MHSDSDQRVFSVVILLKPVPPAVMDFQIRLTFSSSIKSQPNWQELKKKKKKPNMNETFYSACGP